MSEHQRGESPVPETDWRAEYLKLRDAVIPYSGAAGQSVIEMATRHRDAYHTHRTECVVLRTETSCQCCDQAADLNVACVAYEKALDDILAAAQKVNHDDQMTAWFAIGYITATVKLARAFAPSLSSSTESQERKP